MRINPYAAPSDDSHGDARSARRGQFEMVGLVFIVVIIVLGIFLYVTLGAKDRSASTAKSIVHEEAMRSFLLTFAQTEVTECATNVYSVARACAQNEAVGRCARSCDALQDATDNTLDSTLKVQGLNYSLTLEGTSVESSTPGCGPKSMAYAAPQLPIPVSGGTRKMTLTLCS